MSRRDRPVLACARCGEAGGAPEGFPVMVCLACGAATGEGRPPVLPLRVDRDRAEAAVLEALAGPGGTLTALELVVAPWWVLRAEGEGVWRATLGELPRDWCLDEVARDDDLERTPHEQVVPSVHEEVLPANPDGPRRPSRGLGDTRARGRPEVEPLPVVRDAAAAWAERRPSAEAWAILGARQKAPSARKIFDLAEVARWHRVGARLVLTHHWRAEVETPHGQLTLWVDGVDGRIDGLPPPPAPPEKPALSLPAGRVRPGLALALALGVTAAWWWWGR